MDTEALAEYLGGASVWTVRHWRYQKTGPKGIKVGKRVLYGQSDVDRWLSERDEAAT